jgi:hypothetical protein
MRPSQLCASFLAPPQLNFHHAHWTRLEHQGAYGLWANYASNACVIAFRRPWLANETRAIATYPECSRTNPSSAWPDGTGQWFCWHTNLGPNGPDLSCIIDLQENA